MNSKSYIGLLKKCISIFRALVTQKKKKTTSKKFVTQIESQNICLFKIKRPELNKN